MKRRSVLLSLLASVSLLAVPAVQAAAGAATGVAAHPVTVTVARGGRLFVYDFDWDAYDDRAAAWLARHDSSDADNSVAGWRREHGGLHSGATIQGALAARFEPLLKVRRPIWPGCWPGTTWRRRTEQALIDVQVLPALGFWMIARRARGT
jgi:hypothetical protein